MQRRNVGCITSSSYVSIFHSRCKMIYSLDITEDQRIRRVLRRLNIDLWVNFKRVMIMIKIKELTDSIRNV